MTRNIVLVGFMGTGKSAVAAELARMTGYETLEADSEIERRAGRSISEIFETEGEAGFRLREAEVIGDMAARRGAVISTGGGAVLRAANVEALRAGGTVVCLTASTDSILMRTEGDETRPLLKAEDPRGRIEALMASRRPFYEAACATPGFFIRTDGKTPREVAEEIMARIGC